MTVGARVSCVIPVFNEAARLPAVLRAVVGHPMLAEVIVVDDGSTDDSAGVAAATQGVTLIRHPENRGKTRALATGITAAKAPLLLFLDGDLQGLTQDDISRLIAPVSGGQAALSISLRGNAPWLWRLIGLDYISGERVLPRSLLPDDTEVLEKLPHFGFEVYLNRLCIDRQASICVVRWPDVASPLKNQKYGLATGIRADLHMMEDIVHTVPVRDLLAQIRAMRQLMVRC